MPNYQLDIFLLILLIINGLVLILFLLFNEKLSVFLNLIDKVDNSKKIILHNTDTPNNGGVILFLFIIFFYFISFFYNSIISFPNIFLLFIFYFLIGLLDDYFNIKPVTKIFLYIFLTYIILINSTELIIDRFYIETFNAVFYLEIFAIPFTILCIFFMLNALNMSDGINGSLITYTVPVFIIIFSLTSNYLYLMIMLSLIVLLYFNLSNKLFLGNNGSSLISAIISLIIIYETKNNVYILSAEQILLIFSIPTFDLLRLFYTRIINKKNPFLGDLNHFHHIVLNRNQKFIWIPLIISYSIMIYFFSFYIYSILLLLFTLIIYISLLTYFRKYK